MQTNREREQGIGAMSKSMLIVMIITMAGKVTGMLRETILASQYGLSVYTDAFKTAQNLPCLFLSIIVTAISATLIPTYSTQLKQGPEQARRFTNNLYTVGLVFSVLILIITGIFLEPLVTISTQSAQDPRTREIALELARIMMPMGVFVFLARITSAYLQANFNFGVPAFSQLFLNLVIIGSIMLSRGADIMYVAIGTVIGWALQFLVQVPSLRKAGFAYKPTFDLKDSGLREVAILMVPVLISSAFDQVYMFFDTMIAHRGGIGDPTALDYANRVSTMVSSVLLTTVATVLYPNLVRNVGRQKRFMDNLSFGVNLNLLIALPAVLAILLLRVPLTRFVYERGEFTSEGTYLTATLLACYSAGILGVGLRELCNRSFYAFKDTIVPTVVGVGAVVLNIGLNYLLHPIWGAAGIAIGTAIASTLSGLTLLYLLHRKRRVLDTRRVLRCLWKTALSAAVMCVALLALSRALHLATAVGMSLYLGMTAAIVVGVLVYAVMLAVLKTEELWMLLDLMRKRRRGA